MKKLEKLLDLIKKNNNCFIHFKLLLKTFEKEKIEGYFLEGNVDSVTLEKIKEIGFNIYSLRHADDFDFTDIIELTLNKCLVNFAGYIVTEKTFDKGLFIKNTIMISLKEEENKLLKERVLKISSLVKELFESIDKLENYIKKNNT